MTISLIPSEIIEERNIQRRDTGPHSPFTTGTTLVKRGFAHMQKHGVIMDVTNIEQAQIAEDSGAVAVMVLDKLPFDVRLAGGVARTASVKVVQETNERGYNSYHGQVQDRSSWRSSDFRGDRC